MRIGNGVENNDGREDIIMKENGVELLIIREEFYKSFGETYETMKTPQGQASFLATIGIALLRGNKKRGEV
jgi:hypothetical protein